VKGERSRSRVLPVRGRSDWTSNGQAADVRHLCQVRMRVWKMRRGGGRALHAATCCANASNERGTPFAFAMSAT
jgi:hypothetical protein